MGLIRVIYCRLMGEFDGFGEVIGARLGDENVCSKPRQVQTRRRLCAKLTRPPRDNNMWSSCFAGLTEQKDREVKTVE